MRNSTRTQTFNTLVSPLNKRRLEELPNFHNTDDDVEQILDDQAFQNKIDTQLQQENIQTNIDYQLINGDQYDYTLFEQSLGNEESQKGYHKRLEKYMSRKPLYQKLENNIARGSQKATPFEMNSVDNLNLKMGLATGDIQLQKDQEEEEEEEKMILPVTKKQEELLNKKWRKKKMNEIVTKKAKGALKEAFKNPTEKFLKEMSGKREEQDKYVPRSQNYNKVDDPVNYRKQILEQQIGATGIENNIRKSKYQHVEKPDPKISQKQIPSSVVQKKWTMLTFVDDEGNDFQQDERQISFSNNPYLKHLQQLSPSLLSNVQNDIPDAQEPGVIRMKSIPKTFQPPQRANMTRSRHQQSDDITVDNESQQQSTISPLKRLEMRGTQSTPPIAGQFNLEDFEELQNNKEFQKSRVKPNGGGFIKDNPIAFTDMSAQQIQFEAFQQQISAPPTRGQQSVTQKRGQTIQSQELSMIQQETQQAVVSIDHTMSMADFEEIERMRPQKRVVDQQQGFGGGGSNRTQQLATDFSLLDSVGSRAGMGTIQAQTQGRVQQAQKNGFVKPNRDNFSFVSIDQDNNMENRRDQPLKQTNMAIPPTMKNRVEDQGMLMDIENDLYNKNKNQNQNYGRQYVNIKGQSQKNGWGVDMQDYMIGSNDQKTMKTTTSQTAKMKIEDLRRNIEQFTNQSDFESIFDSIVQAPLTRMQKQKVFAKSIEKQLNTQLRAVDGDKDEGEGMGIRNREIGNRGILKKTRIDIRETQLVDDIYDTANEVLRQTRELKHGAGMGIGAVMGKRENEIRMVQKMVQNPEVMNKIRNVFVAPPVDRRETEQQWRQLGREQVQRRVEDKVYDRGYLEKNDKNNLSTSFL